jgi:poly(hydroxyalkanoate) granule-associated protein
MKTATDLIDIIAPTETSAPRKTATKRVARKAVTSPALATKTAPSRSRSKTAAAPTATTVEMSPPTLKQVAVQSRKKVSSVVHLTRDTSLKLIDTQRTIWLAGLGALAKVTTATGNKGEKAFEALVTAGEKIESQARGAINSNADLLKNRIEGATRLVDHGIDTVGDAFDARVKKALARLGYPKAGKHKK